MEYIQLERYSNGGGFNGIDLSLGNNFLGVYSDAANVRIEATCSVYGGGKGRVNIIGRRSSLPTPSISTPNSLDDFATIVGGIVSYNETHPGFVCSSSSDYHDFVNTLVNNVYSFYVDGQKYYDYTYTGKAALWRYSSSTTEGQPGTWIIFYPHNLTTEPFVLKTMRLKRCKIYKDGVSIFDGTPCVKDDTVGMYDSVSGQLRMISMTDYPQFSAGPKV